MPPAVCVSVAGCVEALIITITAAGGGGTLGPLRLSKAPQPCFTAGSCDVFEATSPTSLDDLLEAKVRPVQL